MAPTSFSCRYCNKSNIARSVQGLRSHISQSVKCRAQRDREHAQARNNRSAQDRAPHNHQQETEYNEERLDDGPGPEDNSSPHPNDSTDERGSKRARVDDDHDDFQPTSVNFIVDYPEDAHAGAVLEQAADGLEARFDQIKQMQQAAGQPLWAPFDSLADWELARWLVQSGVSQREIDKFLKLESVRTGASHTGFPIA